MKIEIRLEGENPIIFFLDEVQHDKTIACYTNKGEHSSACRAYMRDLPKPITQLESIKCWGLLERYAKHALYCLNL